MGSARRKISVAVLALAAFGISLVPMCSLPPLETGAYVQAVTESAAVVCIVTAEPTRLALAVAREGAEVAVVAPGEPAARHELRVGSLEPATRYSYEVRDEDGAAIDNGEFVTRSVDDTRPVRFAVAGDTGGQPFWVDLQKAPLVRALRAHRWLPVEDEPRAVAALLLELRPDFWLHTGDVVYPRGAQSHYWSGFFAPFDALIEDVPVYPVLGNHDVMTADGAPFLANFVLPSEGERCFTFREGPLRVIGLDLNGEVGPDHPSIEFLREVGGEASEPWLVVMNHYPVRSAYRELPRTDLEQHYAPLCRELGVDLMLAGHDHNYQRFGEPGETLEIVTGGGGKSLYEFRYEPEGLAVKARAYHACLVEIEGTKLRFRAVAVDGSELDRFEIDKAALLQQGQVRGNAERRARVQALAQ